MLPCLAATYLECMYIYTRMLFILPQMLQSQLLALHCIWGLLLSSVTLSSKPDAKLSVFCSFEGVAHLGPLEDPIRVASRAMACFRASKDKAAWLALPPAAVISAAHARL